MKQEPLEALVANKQLEFVDDITEYLAPYEGLTVEVTIKHKKFSRSDNQNRYYFGVVVKTLADHTGFTKDEMHEVLKHKFLRYWATISGPEDYIEQVEFTKSTTDLNTAEMEQYLENIREWASIQLGCYIPEPGEDCGKV